ncbi:hypothetical protein [Streptomyces sp. B3I8]|uniref:hypothetical protein n=1 Tax=Streptomyces sp. B3I8 TaxID=3042303 RepID=UPI00277E0A0A|nr:hypothetical protein [Streptomyces sp. B3I8]MDQ0788768.1 hypothetical protein [Streptomyces sp. B3I8]
MADEQYRWLDRDTAERLLRGEPHRAVDDEARPRADRLSEVLGALAPPPPRDDAELPGEAAALAAFRAARTADGAETESGQATAAQGADAGLVRLGRPSAAPRRRSTRRPVRLGLAAGLAAVTLGGVAVAAGSGMLPTPFGGDEPEPGTSVTAGVTSRPSDTATADGGGTASPGGTGEATGGGASHDDTGGAGARSGAGEDGTAPRGSREWWNEVLDSCRDVRDGTSLSAERRDVLEDAAGGSGPGRVKSYCRTALASDGGDGPAATNGNTGKSNGEGKGNGKAKGNGNANGGGNGAGGNQGNGNGNANGGGNGNGNGGGGGGGPGKSHGKGNGNGGDKGSGHRGGGHASGAHGPKRP